jgi:hypothetical protein
VAVVRQRINIIPGGLSKFVNFMNELKMKTFISNSMNLKTLVNSICSLRKSLVQFVFVVFKYQSYLGVLFPKHVVNENLVTCVASTSGSTLGTNQGLCHGQAILLGTAVCLALASTLS